MMIALHVRHLGLTAFTALLLVTTSCGGKKNAGADAGGIAMSSQPATTMPGSAMASASAAPSASASVIAVAPAAPAGQPPPDGKYEHVQVEGVTVPMIQVMESGTIVLVDTDGKKPRSWEEQYKKKNKSLLVGQFDLHKTNTNKNDTFEDDSVDKEGLWIIDAKGNISKH